VRTSRRVLSWLMPLALVACSHLGSSAGQPGRFYTVVDAQGRLQTLPLPVAPVSAAAPAVPVVAPAESPDARLPVSLPSVLVVPAGVLAAATGGPGLQEAVPDDRPDLFAPDDAFVDSTVLEAHKFNMQNKKKFGFMTDATGHMYPVYFERDEGTEQQAEAVQAPVVTANVATAVQQGSSNWPAGQAVNICCSALAAAADDQFGLVAKRAYHVHLPAPDCSGAACKPVVFSLPKHPKEHVLRLYSYLSSLSCRVCLQWPTVVVLDHKYQPLRAYVANLGGYKAENWLDYASFHFDVDISDADDAFLMLVQSKGALTYKNKHYQGSDKGEIAFALIP